MYKNRICQKGDIGRLLGSSSLVYQCCYSVARFPNASARGRREETTYVWPRTSRKHDSLRPDIN